MQKEKGKPWESAVVGSTKNTKNVAIGKNYLLGIGDSNISSVARTIDNVHFTT